jgi:hypothetical protein
MEKTHRFGKGILRWSSWYPYVFYLLVCLCIFFPVTAMKPGTYLFGWDTLDAEYFAKSYFSNQVRHGTIPFWDPYLFGGYPYGATILSNLFYPPSYLYAVLPVPVAGALYKILHIWIAASGMYLMCRHWFRPLPSWIAGMTYAFSGMLVPRILAGVTSMIVSAAYMPLIFLAFILCIEQTKQMRLSRWAIPLVIFAVLQWVGGDPRGVIFTWIILGIAGTVYSLFRKTFVPAITVVFTGIMTILISAVNTLPFLELVRHSVRVNQTYDWAASGSLDFSQLRQLLAPVLWTYRPDTNDYMPFFEAPVYIGTLSLILAIGGFTYGIFGFRNIDGSARQKKTAILAVTMSLTAIFGIWVALAKNARVDVFNMLWTYVPGFTVLRGPVRFFMLSTFGLSVLAAFCVENVRNRIVQTVLACLVTIELIAFCRPYVFVRPVPESNHDPSLIALLREAGQARIHPNYVKSARLGYSWDMSAASGYGIFSTSGYASPILKSYNDFFLAAFPGTDPEFAPTMNQAPWVDVEHGAGMDLLNVRYVLVAGDRSFSEPHYSLELENRASYFRLYRNNRTFPRYFLVPYATIKQNKEDIKRAISREEVNFSDSVLIETSEGVSGSDRNCLSGHPGSVLVTSYDINRVELQILAGCDAYLTGSDVHYPGWRATMDGNDVPVLTGNLAFRTVRVTQGNHRLVFWYDPKIYYIGALISLISLCVLFVATRKRGLRLFPAIRI